MRPHARLTRRLLLAMPALVAACGPGPAHDSFTARDSAGIRIIESRASAPGELAAAFSPDDLVLEVGAAAAAADQLSRVAGAGRLADGALAILDVLSHELRIFDADGRHRVTTGGRGGGPAEFGYASAMTVTPAADSVRVWDMGRRQLRTVGADGGFGEPRPVDLESVVPPPFHHPMPVHGTIACSRSATATWSA